MRADRLVAVVALSVALISGSSCTRDPNVRKQKYFEAGNRYFEKSQYDEAAIEYLNAIKIDPRLAKAHFQLAETYIHLREWPAAYREMLRTVELDPNNVRAQISLGSMLGAGKSFAEAQAVADKLLHEEPNNADVLVLQANLNIAQGKRDAGIEELRKAIAIDPNRPEFYVQLAGLQSADEATAETNLKTALQLDPKYLPAMQSLADLYQSSGRNLEAESLLKQAIALDPQDLGSRQYLARLYWLENRKADAEQVMIQAKKDLGREGDRYRVLGEYYNNVGEGDKALAEFASISKDHPDDTKTEEDYIRLLLSHNRVDEGERLNEAILKDNPKDIGAQIIWGTILNLKGKFDDAERVLEDALKNAPEDGQGHYQLGVVLSRKGDLGQAEQEWRLAAKLAPQMTEALWALAETAQEKGDIEVLRETAEQLIRSKPSDPRGYILRAESEVKPIETAAAQADLNKSIQIAPESALGYTAMGNFLRSHGKDDEAQKYYEEALDRDAHDFEPLAGIASVLMLEKQSVKAQTRVQAQIEKSANSDSMYALLGGLQIANKNLAEAEVSLQKAIQLNPGNVDAFTLLSKVEIARGEGDAALTTAYKSIAANPRNVAAYFFAGTMEEFRGRPQTAEEVYRKALQIEPNYAPAANNLAYLMLERGENMDMAFSLAQVARQQMPDSPAAADTLAWIYYRKGLYSFAADLLREALQKAPENATYHYHLGMVYQKQNNTTAARKQLQRALEINPRSPVANEIRQTLNRMS